MKKSMKIDELFLWVVMLIPFIYLAFIWSSLPETVPIHFNAEGMPDDWGSKNVLIWAPALMIFITYGIFLLIPKIDPKQKLETMGKKYNHIKWIIIGLMSALSVLIIYSASKGDTGMNINLLFASLGLFYLLLGNYFPTIKHNYFVGIRTPWTLENETIWKKTHRMAGGWWMAGGAIILLTSLFLNKGLALPIFIAITVLIVIIPFVYSYIEFRKLSNTSASTD